MFQETIFFMAYWGFFENFRFLLCHQGKLHQNLSDRVEFFCGYLRVYPRGYFELFQKSRFLFAL